MKTYHHFIAGAWREPRSKSWIETIDPANGRPWAAIAQGTEADAEQSVAAAHLAFTEGPWAGASGDERAAALTGLADRLERHWQELVEPEVSDNGKRITEVRAQLSNLHSWYRHFATEALKVAPEPLANGLPGVENTAYYEPYGVVAAITPWNSPLMIAAWKIGPALAAGNTVVVKPSEHASASTLEFARLAAEAGLPAGVLNVVTGYGPEVGEPLVRHPLTRKVTFTGSDIGGRKVAESAAAGPIPTTLELGGKSPQIVFADSDLESTVNGVLSGIFLSNGQTCVAGSRLLVEAPLHDVLVARIVERAKALRAGDPMDPRTEIAPLSNKPHLDKVLAMIAQAKDQGACCLCGGERILSGSLRGGYYVAPTVFTQVTPAMPLWREEVFGPVLAVTAFETEADAVVLANDTDFGLATGIWTTDEARAARLTRRIAAGTVYVNHYRSVAPGSPIGGYKRSGYGRELGPDAVKDFLQTKSVWVGTAPCADPFPSQSG